MLMSGTAVAPSIEIRWLNTESREDGADLLPMHVPVMKCLCEKYSSSHFPYVASLASPDQHAIRVHLGRE